MGNGSMFSTGVGLLPLSPAPASRKCETDEVFQQLPTGKTTAPDDDLSFRLGSLINIVVPHLSYRCSAYPGTGGSGQS